MKRGGLCSITYGTFFFPRVLPLCTQIHKYSLRCWRICGAVFSFETILFRVKHSLCRTSNQHLNSSDLFGPTHNKTEGTVIAGSRCSSSIHLSLVPVSRTSPILPQPLARLPALSPPLNWRYLLYGRVNANNHERKFAICTSPLKAYAPLFGTGRLTPRPWSWEIYIRA